jgi:DNA repair protein SbcD/Mre11
LQTIDTQPCPAVYTGSPLAYSFSEANQEKFVMLVDVEPHREAVLTPIALNSGMKLLRKRFTNVDEAVDWLSAHNNAYVELTLATDTYLTAEERKRLHNAHPFIVTLIPEVANANPNTSSHKQIDLGKGMEELFVDYFSHRHKGQAPSDDMMNLFREVLGDVEEDIEAIKDEKT